MRMVEGGPRVEAHVSRAHDCIWILGYLPKYHIVIQGDTKWYKYQTFTRRQLAPP